ncbi:MAG: Crp/Fnr family transcriptional regulator [bacterium]|nr:Crp/Fnr family transcriptional regulator [bacterium]
MSKYEEVQSLIETLDETSKEYLKEYFKNAPAWLYDSLQIVNYPSNYTFIEQGTKVQTITILCKGLVKGTDYPILGAMYDFMWFDPVKCFGSLEYMVKEPMFNASLITATPCTVLQLPMAIYAKWMQLDLNALYMDSSSNTSQLLYEIRRERIYIFMQGTDRLTYFLTLYYKQFASDGTCHITLTRQEISDSTGLSLRTVNRGLTTLIENECILKSGNNLVIHKQQYDRLNDMLADLL